MFGDRMNMGEAVALKMDCGHPNVPPGNKCTLCGSILPEEDPEKKDGEKSQSSER